MFEDKTIDNINKEMLDNVDDTYEKSTGYPTADIIKSFAIESSILWGGLQSLFNKLDVDLLEGDDLAKYVKQRKGIIKKEATKSKGIVTVSGNGNIKIGDLFSTANNVQFQSIENVIVSNTANVHIEAMLPGNVGMVGANSITQFPITLQGITGANNTNATTDGFDAENDDSLRQRYYEALQIPATSGNRYHYLQWAKEVSGVGDAKVLPLWNGANTVKVIIIDSNKQPASTDLVANVQNYIDPGITGTGAGVAPIGAYCTVVSATALNINISVDAQELPNFTIAEITNNIEASVTQYLKDIAFQQDFVSYAKISSVILSTTGVKDFTNLTVNGANSNITISSDQVAVLGGITVV